MRALGNSSATSTTKYVKMLNLGNLMTTSDKYHKKHYLFAEYFSPE